MREYGRVGGSLRTGFTSKDRARQGVLGEEACARLLRRAFAGQRDVAVFHDVFLPGSTANVDHVVATGNRILLVDAKRWKPGIYVTVAGRTFRATRRGGVEHFAAADKGTLPMAVRVAREQLGARVARSPELGDVLVAGALLIDPSGPGLLSVGALRANGRPHVRSMSAPTTGPWLRQLLGRPAMPATATMRMLHSWTSDRDAVAVC